MLNKANRLKKRKEFNYIYKKGQMAHSADFTIHYVQAFKPYAQIGISVSKTVGNSVVRSRVKRIISEACRLNIDKFAIKNYIFTPKPSIVNKKSTEVETEILSLLKKNGLIKGENDKPKLKTEKLEQPKIFKQANVNDKEIKTEKVQTKKTQVEKPQPKKSLQAEKPKQTKVVKSKKDV